MARLRCSSCLGEYDDLGADGVPYYHACPPITTVHVTRDGAEQDVPVTDLRPTDSVTVTRAGARQQVLVSEIQRDDVREGDGLAPRPDARDENTAIVGGVEVPDRLSGRRRRIKAAGRGATVITEPRTRDAV